ncbi:MAG: cyclic pyranopterin monophosphate synthase MoaC [Kiritimatiellae bacterium]|nr:cyclic pyranopterin monophosphate synthase MoaC [Kiritimatiellia bacterium]
MTELSHVDENNRPRMVDVSAKDVTLRQATARTQIQVSDAIFSQISDGDIASKKGPVFQTAIIAGTQAVKQTSTLIPFCHPLAIEGCKIQITTPQTNLIEIICTVKIHGRTGVEMEALTGASVAALTIYDMCKAITHEMVICDTRLIEKSGGKRDVHIPST